MNILRFLLSLVLLVSINSYLAAQEAEEESVEEVVVTGSRIATSEFEGAQPFLHEMAESGKSCKSFRYVSETLC